MPTSVTLTDVVAYILDKADDNDLDTLTDTIRQRRQAITAASIKEGVTVTIRNVSPKYLNGLCGVVKAIETRGRKPVVTITLDRESTNRLGFASNKFAWLAGKDSYDLNGIPISCCLAT